MPLKTCTVAYATPARQWLWTVSLAGEGTVGDAIEQARALAAGLDIPWDGETGIFGEFCTRAAVPRDGDRIEIYRALSQDPKVSRRARAAAGKAAGGRASARPPTSSPKTR